MSEEKDNKEERLLPIANISRIMKKVLPESAKMSKEAKAGIQECVSEFIGFITSESSDRLLEDKRKTITGDDVIDAMRALGFEQYIPYLEDFLLKYRHTQRVNKTKKHKGAGEDDEEEEDDDEG